MGRRTPASSTTITTLLSLAGLVAALQTTLVIPLLPDFPEILDVSAGAATWLVTITLLIGAISVPTLSRLADMYGKRPLLYVCLAIMAAASADSRRGLNAGVVQNVFGSVLGTAMAPIVLVWIAQNFGWREAFYLAGIPGLVLALLIWRFIAEPDPNAIPAAAGSQEGGLSPWRMLRERNVLLCSIISCFSVGSTVIGSIFMPLYLDGPRGIPAETWKWTMSVVGLCPAIGGVLVAALSDRIGRKPPMVAFAFLMALGPLALLMFNGSIVPLTALMFVSWMGLGIFPLFMGVVPAETLGGARAATAMGLVVAAGELTGGVFGPIIAGKLADNYSLDVPMWLQAGFALAAGVFALGLRETNPRVLARKSRQEGLTA